MIVKTRRQLNAIDQAFKFKIRNSISLVAISVVKTNLLLIFLGLITSSAQAISTAQASKGETLLIQPSTIEAGNTITSLLEELPTLAKSKLPRQELESLSKRWQLIARGTIDDTSLANSDVGKILIKHVEAISSFIDYEIGQRVLDIEETVRELNRQLEALLNLIKLTEAANDSIHTTMLIVSSIACECETQRCIRMLGLCDSIFCNGREDNEPGSDSPGKNSNDQGYGSSQWQTSTAQMATYLNRQSRQQPKTRVAILDFVQVPEIEEVVGGFEIPSWILFDRRGKLSALIAGNSDPIDIADAITRWLAETNTDPKDQSKAIKPDQTNNITQGGLQNGK